MRLASLFKLTRKEFLMFNSLNVKSVFIGTLVCAVFVSSIQLAFADPKQLMKKGVNEYNEKHYKAAQRTFTKYVQLKPKSSKGYLFLGRAAFYNDDSLTAALAYAIHISLSKGLKGSQLKAVKNEYQSVAEKLKPNVLKRKKKETPTTVSTLMNDLKSDSFSQVESVIESLNRLIKSGVFHPKLHDLYRLLETKISRELNKLYDHWVALDKKIDPKQVNAMLKVLKHMTKAGWSEKKQWVDGERALRSLMNLHNDPSGSLKLLQKYPDQTFMWRYAQLLGLLAMKRYEEAYLLADALLLKVPKQHRGKLLFLKGVAGIHSGHQEAHQALAEAILTPEQTSP